MQLRKILVPTDFADASDLALERALDLARLVHGEIHLLHAYEPPVSIGAVDLPVALPQDYFERIREAAQRQLDSRAQRAESSGIPTCTHLVLDTPARAILEFAEKLAVDLIVMGTHGRTGMKHMLLGSVAERIVRLATCPVMTVKVAHG